ncbi:MAG: DUF3347 domain-containing protein [Aequorivita sp.]
MKKVRITTAIMALAFLSLTAMSCRDTKREDSRHRMDSEMMDDGHHHDSSMNHENMGESQDMMASDAQNFAAKQVVADYMLLKDALVATDEKAASNAGKKLENTLKGFKAGSYTSEQQKELKDIIEDAIEHAEHIGKSEIAHQREHFQMLTKDITDMVAITGTDNTLYQQFCPMYADAGGTWLSMEKEIKNPYFGSKMMKCGEVQKEIN